MVKLVEEVVETDADFDAGGDRDAEFETEAEVDVVVVRVPDADTEGDLEPVEEVDDVKQREAVDDTEGQLEAVDEDVEKIDFVANEPVGDCVGDVEAEGDTDALEDNDICAEAERVIAGDLDTEPEVESVIFDGVTMLEEVGF